MLKRILIGMLLVAAGRTARADWYSDGKAIIEQVIEDDLSTQVIPNAAARVPALCTYFPSSMNAIKEKRYTGLQTVLRKEISDFIGYAVYYYIADAPVLNNFSELSSQRVGMNAGQLVEASMAAAFGQQTPVATSCLDSAGDASFHDQTSIATLQMTTCAIVQPDPTLEVACAAGITISDAFDGNDTALADDVKRLADALKAMVNVEIPGLDKLVAKVHARNALTIEAAVVTATALGEACKINPVCNRLAQWMSKSGGVQGLAAILAAIQKRDYGSAARAVIMSSVALACQGQSSMEICKADKQVILTFITNLSVYLIDSASSGQVAESAEADFQASIVGLIEHYGSGLGYTRAWWRPKAILYPQLSLRDSWRPGHVSVDGSEMMSYASIEFPTVRYPVRYSQFVFLAPQVSLFDLLGPFSEIATSGHLLDSAEHRSKAFLMGFVVPRLDIEFGVPAVSRNLTIGAGVAFRFYRMEPAGMATAKYCFVGDCAVTTDNFEFGVHVTYVP